MKSLLFLSLLFITAKSAAQSTLLNNQDSLSHYQYQLNHDIYDLKDFNEKCAKIIKYKGGYDFIIEHLEIQQRHAITHEYFPGFIMFLIQNKNAILIDKFKAKVESNLMPKYIMEMVIPYLFTEPDSVCKYLESLSQNGNNTPKDQQELQDKLDWIQSRQLYKDLCPSK